MKSYWINSTEEKKGFNKLNQDIETDICIIGGGLTGLSVAYYLEQYKIKNVILEKDRICHRTSGFSTAKITSQHDLFYKYLIDSKGKEIAQKYYEANEEAIAEIERIIEKENIDCDFKKQSAYVFTQSINDVQKIKDEVEAVKQIGGIANYIEAQDIELNKLGKETNIPKNEIDSSMEQILPIKALCAIEFPNQAQFNPYKYALALAEKCTKGSTQIYENSKVIDIRTEDSNEESGEISLEEFINKVKNNITKEKQRPNYIIELEHGRTIKAKHIVIATKYPIINFPGYYFLKMYQSTSNVIAIEPKEKPIKGMYINSENPTISIRTVEDNGENLVLIAGFDHKTGAKIDLENSYKYLEKIAKSLYPNCEKRYQWNTEDCISLDKIPYIGSFSNIMQNVYVATGYKKWGITTSNIAARMIVDEIMGKEVKYKDVFKATRLEPIKNIKEVGNMLKQTVNSLVIEKLEMPKETLEQIQTDEGKIVDVEGKKVGIYKDNRGEIFAVKPVCMHLGCELSWNNLDKTWDCPCHGSRYNYKGELIYGPSVKNLEKP